MSVPDCFLNSTVTFTRPVRGGRGGAQSAAPVVLHSDVPADYQPNQKHFRTDDGRNVIQTGTLRLNLEDQNGKEIEVDVGDLVTVFFRSKTKNPEEIVARRIWAHDLDTDHVFIAIGRSGVAA